MTLAGGYRIARAQQISLEQRLPFVHLVESAGGDLMNYTVENYAEGDDLFGALAKLSKEEEDKCCIAEEKGLKKRKPLRGT